MRTDFFLVFLCLEKKSNPACELTFFLGSTAVNTRKKKEKRKEKKKKKNEKRSEEESNEEDEDNIFDEDTSKNKFKKTETPKANPSKSILKSEHP